MSMVTNSCLYAATELAKEKLAGVQKKIKLGYDRRAERHVFSPGDQVLALMPLVSSPFQAKFMGPYTVIKQLSDQNYVISTPERRKHHQLCHGNLLKAYHERESSEQGPVAEFILFMLLTQLRMRRFVRTDCLTMTRHC